jgi:hypothetical protein
MLHVGARCLAADPQLTCPDAGAVRASRLMASFRRIQGRPRSNREKKPTLSSRASCAEARRSETAMPAARSRSIPSPATRGLGSTLQHTTRRMPAAISASAQGGVRPVWLQGSRVT